MIGIISLVLAVASTDLVVVDSQGDGLRSTTTINGFDAELMPSVQSCKATTSGYPSWDHRCYPLHPYFLRAGLNAIRVSYTLQLDLVEATAAGPFREAIKVSTMTTTQPRTLTELAAQAGPALTRADADKARSLSTSFKLPPTQPSWDWTTSSTITNGEATRNTLYAEYQKLWATLQGMPKAAVADRALFAKKVKASMADFIKASSLRGKPFTFVDDLVSAASLLGFAGDKEMLEEKAKEPEVPLGAPMQDQPYSGPETGTHLSLAPLTPLKDLKLTVFAEGRLARLDTPDTNPPFIYFSNWHDGSWSSAGEAKISFEAWFRKNAKGEWELAALYPTMRARMATLSVESMLDEMPF